jgi:hypothetical protein
MRATTSGGRLGALLNEPRRPSVVVKEVVLAAVVSMVCDSCGCASVMCKEEVEG